LANDKIPPHPTFDLRRLTLEVTRQCNNNCSYCYQKRERRRKGDPGVLAGHISRFRREGARSIEFSGGEPTLYPGLPALVGWAKKEGYENIALLTNGRRLAYKPYCDALIRSGVKTFVFSVPASNGPLYAKITKTSPGAFEESIKGMENVTSASSLEAGSVTVLLRENFRQMGKIAELLIAQRMDFLTFICPFPRDPADVNNRLSLSAYTRMAAPPEELAPVLIKTIEKYGRRIKICLEGAPFCLLKGYEPVVLNESASRSGTVITAEGRIQRGSGPLWVTGKREERCLDCGYLDRCFGFFSGRRKEPKIQKVALDIQNGPCPYMCTFCTRQIAGVPFHDLDDEKEKAVADLGRIKLFFDTSVKRNKSLDIWGREGADAYEGLPALLDLARQSGFKKITLWTSGTRFNDPSHVKDLIKKGVTGFEMPLYGHNRDIHERITRTPGSYKKWLAAMEILRRLGGADIKIHTVLIRQNHLTLPHWLHFLSTRFPECQLSVWFYYPDSLLAPQDKARYEAHCVSFSEVIAAFKDFKKMIPARTVTTAFMPLCILRRLRMFYRGFEPVPMGPVRLYVFDKEASTFSFLPGRREFNSIFAPQCDRCRLKKECPGIFKEYRDIYGVKEFTPLEN